MDPIEDVDVPGLLCEHPRILQNAWRVQSSSAIIHESYRKYGQLRPPMDPIEGLEISELLCDHVWIL